ncbi:SLC13 family permease [Candidatus Leptofilum sp.]|uniref:SLC13 family permease n=1 Tax=Candidatus Leptofilum sp. TaxID=3241576 RepID=UPI003B5B8A87
MTFDHILVLGILTIAVGLFISDRLRVDLVALLVLLALILTGLLTPEAAFAGFASPAVITVWAVFIISGAMFQSGVADLLAQQMLRLAGDSPTRLLIVIMVTAGIMSAFMNNIGAVAILLPAVVAIGRSQHIAPSKLLMPLAFAALLGGNMTLIGTPPNILAATILEDYGGVEPFQFFDFLPMGIIVLVAGILYMLLFGRHLLPERQSGDELVDAYPVREYVTEVRVSEASSLIGQTVKQSRFGEQFDLNILRVRHEDDRMDSPITDRLLGAGDVLLIEGPLSNILKVSRTHGLQLAQEWESQGWHPSVETEGMDLIELTLAPYSEMTGLTLKEMGFRARFGLSVLAIRHNGKSITDHLGDVPIDFGDALLVQGAPNKFGLLRTNPDFLVLDTPQLELRRTDKAAVSLVILFAVLLTATFGWLSITTTMVLGAVLMILAGVLTMDEAYRAIDWQSVFLIAGMLPLGIAMEETGTARLLADQLVNIVGGLGPVAVLAGVFLLTALLTEVISNAAAAVLMVPIAIDAGFGLGVAPEPFVMATVLAASTSFLMPVGHQVNVIIYGPGGYRFSDYARVGIWLNLIILGLVLTVLPLFWPF